MRPSFCAIDASVHESERRQRPRSQTLKSRSQGCSLPILSIASVLACCSKLAVRGGLSGVLSTANTGCSDRLGSRLRLQRRKCEGGGVAVRSRAQGGAQCIDDTWFQSWAGFLRFSCDSRRFQMSPMSRTKGKMTRRQAHGSAVACGAIVASQGSLGIILRRRKVFR